MQFVLFGSGAILCGVGKAWPRGRCASLFGSFEVHFHSVFELRLTAMVHFAEMVPVPPHVLPVPRLRPEPNAAAARLRAARRPPGYQFKGRGSVYM